MKKLTLLSAPLFAVTMALSGCQSAYYSAMESVGVHKRDILVDRVEETKEAQQESQEEFQSALDRLTTLINFDGGELQDAYNQLNDDYESSLAAANCTLYSARRQAIWDLDILRMGADLGQADPMRTLWTPFAI